MKKFSLIVIMILVLCLALTACNGNGNGKEEKTIEIKSVEDLKEVRDYLGEEYSLYTFELKKDLDLSDEQWEPIGYDNKNSFRATFEGNNHTISNLSIIGANGSEYEKKIPYLHAGLFGYVYDATIQNIELSDYDISFFVENDYNHIGGLVGYAYGDTTISDIEVNGNIDVGTVYNMEQRSVLMDYSCNQYQYLGGIVGYSAGDLSFKDSVSDVEVKNLIGSRGPVYDEWEEDYVYEKNEDGEDTDTILKEVVTSKGDPAFYPNQVFAGGMIGFAKGYGTELENLHSRADITELYAKSAYLGGVIGAGYNTNISNNVYEGNLATTVYVKGVSGGIAGIIDESAIINAEVSNSEIDLNVVKSEYQSYTTGSIAGYANDFSKIQNSEVINTKILSNLENVQSIGDKNNFPVIGGVAGTLRDSSILDCNTDGGVYKSKSINTDGTYSYTDIDNKFIYTAGIAADVYGNSNIERCESAFASYKGAVAKYSENIYVESNGERILRYTKEKLPKVFVGIDAYVEDDVLIVDIINDAGDIIGTYTYNDYTGNNIEEYSENYYEKATGRLVDEDGIVIVIDGRTFDGYERLTGMYSFEEVDYKESATISIGEDDIDIEEKEGWKRFKIN